MEMKNVLTQYKKRKRNKLKCTILVIFVLVFLVVIVWFMISKNTDNCVTTSNNLNVTEVNEIQKPIIEGEQPSEEERIVESMFLAIQQNSPESIVPLGLKEYLVEASNNLLNCIYKAELKNCLMKIIEENEKKGIFKSFLNNTFFTERAFLSPFEKLLLHENPLISHWASIVFEGIVLLAREKKLFVTIGLLSKTLNSIQRDPFDVASFCIKNLAAVLRQHDSAFHYSILETLKEYIVKNKQQLIKESSFRCIHMNEFRRTIGRLTALSVHQKSEFFKEEDFHTFFNNAVDYMNFFYYTKGGHVFYWTAMPDEWFKELLDTQDFCSNINFFARLNLVHETELKASYLFEKDLFLKLIKCGPEKTLMFFDLVIIKQQETRELRKYQVFKCYNAVKDNPEFQNSDCIFRMLEILLKKNYDIFDQVEFLETAKTRFKDCPTKAEFQNVSNKL